MAMCKLPDSTIALFGQAELQQPKGWPQGVGRTACQVEWIADCSEMLKGVQRYEADHEACQGTCTPLLLE